jgi:hypothetical protein
VVPCGDTGAMPRRCRIAVQCASISGSVAIGRSRSGAHLDGEKGQGGQPAVGVVGGVARATGLPSRSVTYATRSPQGISAITFGATPGSPGAARRGGQQSAQCAEHGAVEPGQSRPGVRAAQYRDLVPKCQDLGVLGGVGAGEQRQPAQHANEQQVDESEGHSRRSCWLPSGTVMSRLRAGNVLLSDGDEVLGTHRQFSSVNPAISKDALKRIGEEVRSWRLHLAR